MAEYLSPDVSVEEGSSNQQTIERVSSSVAAFMGIAERGPVNTPVLITSFAQYKRIFGGYLSNRHLTYAVEGFFKKVKGRCYVTRVTHYTQITDEKTVTSAAATATLLDRAATPVPIFTVSAGSCETKKDSHGDWGNKTKVVICESSLGGSDQFRMKVYYSTVAVAAEDAAKILKTDILVESHDNLVMDSTNANYALKIVNGRSDYIRLTLDADNKTASPDNRPAVGTFTLTDGADGITGLTNTDFAGNSASRTGVYAFDPVDEINILTCPGITTVDVHNALCGYADLRGDIFSILDPPQGMTVSEIKEYVQDTAAFSCNYAAIYYPNLIITDPLTSDSMIMSPSGQLAGIYAKTDVVRGVHKAPAGIEDGVFTDIIGLEYTLDKGQRDTLYPARINPIIKKRGVGFVAWGNRTVSAMSDWRSINVRRLFLNICESIAEGTEWAVFKPNNQDLWRNLRTAITLFLKQYWREGAFYDAGSGKWQDAFYVKCDGELNTQSIVDQYKVITEIGIAPTKAAEFVIFRISQWDGGRLIEEVG